jgi:hypothetical protein
MLSLYIGPSSRFWRLEFHLGISKPRLRSGYLRQAIGQHRRKHVIGSIERIPFDHQLKAPHLSWSAAGIILCHVMMQSTCVEKRRLGRIFRNYMTVMKHPILSNRWLGGASELRQTVGDCAENMPVVFSKSIMWKQSRVISISVSPRHTATNPAKPRSELEHRACPNCCLINSVLLEDHGIRVCDLVHDPPMGTIC